MARENAISRERKTAKEILPKSARHQRAAIARPLQHPGLLAGQNKLRLLQDQRTRALALQHQSDTITLRRAHRRSRREAGAISRPLSLGHHRRCRQLSARVFAGVGDVVASIRAGWVVAGADAGVDG